jgi:hypothetical protein
MAVREDCRHYLRRSTPTGEVVQRCRLSVNEDNPFACPEGCLFFEPRNVSSAGWTQASADPPLSNTGQGLIGLPEQPGKRRRGRKKGR